jgi:hypothetical protein
LINLVNKVILYERNFVFTAFTLPHLYLLVHFCSLCLVTWLEYLRAAAYLVKFCFLSLHRCFPEFYSLIVFSEKSSKIKFLEKFQKNLFKFLCHKWGREAPGRPQGDLPRHLTTRGRSPSPGRAHLWWGGPLASHLSLPPQLFLSPENNDTPAQTRVLAALHLDFSISLLSPLLLLRFGAFVLRYVTPPIVEVEFCLVKYFLSILAL